MLNSPAIPPKSVRHPTRNLKDRAIRAARRTARKLAAKAVGAGANPAWFQYRVIQKEPLADFCARRRNDPAVHGEVVHRAEAASNPLPLNIRDPAELPGDRGWWGYSFRDVPQRRSGQTFLATLPDCRIVPRIDEKGDFWVAILNDENRALVIREMALRREHRDVLRDAPVETIEEGVWMLERVYDNYSHWLTAHLPKLLLLRSLGLAEKVILPQTRPKFIDDCLRLFGFEPERFQTFDPGKILRVKRLTTLDTDRFRPDLLRLVRDACPSLEKSGRDRRVFISRKGASRRRLLNEDELWPLLETRGFERVRMEELSFSEQVALMQETEMLCAPHGAGLTNMMFCSPGTQVIEMADLSFPNPNFYAVACAMRHDYWLVSAEGVGDVHPLEKDMRVQPQALKDALEKVDQKPLSFR